MIGDFLRNSGKHIAKGAVNKGFKGYGKANKKASGYAKAGAKKGLSHFKSLVTKSERHASKSLAVKRQKQSRQLKRIK